MPSRIVPSAALTVFGVGPGEKIRSSMSLCFLVFSGTSAVCSQVLWPSFDLRGSVLDFQFSKEPVQVKSPCVHRQTSVWGPRTWFLRTIPFQFIVESHPSP